MKKRIALTCKDPGQFFRNCRLCKHYEKCDYFNKAKEKRKRKLSKEDVPLEGFAEEGVTEKEKEEEQERREAK